MIDAEEAEIAAWLSARSDKVIETACARVYLAGDTAFKLKRRVDLGYLDYSTLERRLWALERELKFNRAAASDIYRSVRTLTRTNRGELSLDGAGRVVDHVLEMRRFDETAVLSVQPWAIDGDLAEALGRTVAGFHVRADDRPAGGGVKALKYTIDSNAHLLTGFGGRLGVERVKRLVETTYAELSRQGSLLDARAAAGLSRHCHGDLHLGNILLENDQPILFDCIEFNDVLSDIDVQYDLAFLLMDLVFRRRSDAAVRVLSAYFDEAARSWKEPLRAGLACLPLMLSVRAAVRAHVCANQNQDEAARAYLEAALGHLEPKGPSLTAVGGLSGSGKTTFSRLVAPGLAPAPGAIVLRTDEVRKRQMGVGPGSSLPSSVYSASLDAQVYGGLLDDARGILKAGWSVVLDATFIQPDMRAAARALADDLDVPFQGAWLDAPAEVLASRIVHREGDASDATVATLRMQMERDVGTMTWRRVDATGPARDSAEAWIAAIAV